MTYTEKKLPRKSFISFSKKAKTRQINIFTLTIKYPKLRLSCLMLIYFLLIQLSFSYININDVKNKVWEHGYTKHFASFMITLSEEIAF